MHSKSVPIFFLACLLFLNCRQETNSQNSIHAFYPNLNTGNSDIDKAFRIAVGDLFSNIQMYKSGLMAEQAPVILAGLDYNRPWTRDASINSWNAGSLIVPDVAKNTLLSVLHNDDNQVRIGGQYWDAVVWITGAWHHYLMTGDEEFLRLAYESARNSLAFFEETEFDSDYNLFRGLGWSDGVAAYEGKYEQTNGNSAAWSWPAENPDKALKIGYGIPMMAISTNCLYYNAYKTVDLMATELGIAESDDWPMKAESLKQAINTHLWNEETGVYNFYIDPDTVSDLQETLGNSYAILFGVADEEQRNKIFKNQYVAPAGVPCGWPPLPRYKEMAEDAFSRHNGTVWPQIQGFWAESAARHQEIRLFSHELFNLARHAVRDQQFAEIYHPITGEQYGGWQERGEKGISLWRATNRQTWAATAYLRMVFNGLAGMRVDPNGIRFEPCLPDEFDQINLTNVHFQNMTIDVNIQGSGAKIEKVKINGKNVSDSFLRNTASGSQKVEIIMGK
jgi:glycogen debranching enzyme